MLYINRELTIFPLAGNSTCRMLGIILPRESRLSTGSHHNDGISLLGILRKILVILQSAITHTIAESILDTVVLHVETQLVRILTHVNQGIRSEVHLNLATGIVGRFQCTLGTASIVYPVLTDIFHTMICGSQRNMLLIILIRVVANPGILQTRSIDITRIFLFKELLHISLLAGYITPGRVAGILAALDSHLQFLGFFVDEIIHHRDGRITS